MPRPRTQLARRPVRWPGSATPSTPRWTPSSRSPAGATSSHFADGIPDPALFDTEGIRSAHNIVLSRGGARALQYSGTAGDPELRALIADRMTTRQLPTDPGQLVVTTGSQQALHLVAATFLDPGDVVLVEEPCYLAALQCFRLAGARVVPVPSDEHGILPAALDAVAARERPKLVYLVPTFQNPTGRTLDAERRGEVARIVAERGLWIVEDDPYGELRYSGLPVAPLAAHPEASDRTVTLGSFSKIRAPGLRIGWLRAPAHAHGWLTAVKQMTALHSSTLIQAATAAYLRTTDLDAHVARLREAYAPRRDAMLSRLPDVLPPGSSWNTPEGRMFLWVRLPGPIDTTALLPHALDAGVAFVPGAPFYAHEPDRATMRLSFVTTSYARTQDGLERLGMVLARC